MNSKAEQYFNPPIFVFSLGVALGCFSLLAGGVRFWQNGILILPSTTFGLFVSAGIAAAGFLWARARRAPLRFETIGFVAVLVLLFFSDWLVRRFNLMQGPYIRGEIVFFALLSLPFLSKARSEIFPALLLISSCLLAYLFFLTADGRLLTSDDHSTFFYRLALLKENFPQIPFYSPHWNAGIDARDFFATGALNIFSLSAPLLYLFSVEQTYNTIVALLLFALTPASCYFAARFLEIPRNGAAIAALLGMTTSLTWYKWALHYGTLGFVTTVALTPINLALATRILSREHRLSFPQACFLLISLTLMLFWSPSGIAFLPLIALGLFQLPTLLKKRYVPQLMVALFVLNVPWILIFWASANVSGYLVSDEPFRKPVTESVLEASGPESVSAKEAEEVSEQGFLKQLELQKSLQVLRSHAASANPLLLFLLLPGIFLLRRNFRLPIGLYLGWLLILSTVFLSLVHRLDLDRMLVFFLIAATIPSSLAIHELFLRASKSRTMVIPAAIVCGFLLSGILSTGGIIRNRSLVRYNFSSPLVENMTRAIRKHHQNGRILFSGFILHELNHSHIGPLAHFTGIPMIASSYVHRYWKYTEVFPHDFLVRKDEGGIEEYLDLYNVGAVFAHERKWREYFLRKSDLYAPAWKEDRFWLFQRKNFLTNYFLEGEGKVLEQNSNSVTLSMSTDEGVIKFHYLPFVTADGCAVSGKEVEAGITFIHLTNCSTDTPITIHSKHPFSRVL